MQNNERGDQIERSEVWTIAIVVPLFVLLVQVVVVAVCWDRLCAKIVLNALEYGTEQVVSRTVFDTPPPMQDRRATSYRPSPPKQPPKSSKVKEYAVWENSLLGEQLVREAKPELFVETSDWKVITIQREPSHNPDRSREYDYFVRYQMPNGATDAAIMRGEPLTVETIKKGVLADIERTRQFMLP